MKMDNMRIVEELEKKLVDILGGFEWKGTVVASLNNQPFPMTPEFIAVAVTKGLIPKADLIDGKYYYGRCRNARVARWDKTKGVFWYMRTKFGQTFAEDINHPEDDDSFDLFWPVAAIDPEDGELVPIKDTI